jgi:hypothetical protein
MGINAQIHPLQGEGDMEMILLIVSLVIAVVRAVLLLMSSRD